MIEQQAQIVRVSDRRTWVRVGPAASGCAACDAGRGCGAGLLGRLLRRRPVTLAFDGDGFGRVGEAVTVGIPEALYLRSVFRQYGLPLLAGLAGAVIGHQIGQTQQATPGVLDAMTLAAALVAGAAALRWLRRHGGHGLDASALVLMPGAGGCEAGETTEPGKREA